MARVKEEAQEEEDLLFSPPLDSGQDLRVERAQAGKGRKRKR